MPASRLENLLWPRWLPETARMPVVAQITGAVALTALIMGPWWSRVDTPSPAAAPASSGSSAVPASPASPASPAAPVPERAAHLNLDVRHTFSSVDLTVTVDGKRLLATRLAGSGKKFKMFGKRPERSFTRTLDLQPGVRLVRVNLKSAEDRFDQTRVERFELASATVASLRITADKAAGLAAIAERPLPATPVPSQATESGGPPVAAAAIPLPASVTPGAPSIPQRADPLGELLNSLRSMLIAIAGFVASTSTGFLIQEFLRSKRSVLFAGAAAGGAAAVVSNEEAEAAGPRRRRRRSGSHSSAAAD